MNASRGDLQVNSRAHPVAPLDSPKSKGASRTAIVAILLLLAVLPYVNTLQNGFVYDDHNEVLTNPYIRSFKHVREIFSTRVLEHLGVRGATNYYRPVSIFGFLLCYQFFGDIPYGFHLANVLLNAAVVLLLFFVTERLFRNTVLACVAAGIFALHPIHAESVAWVSAVTDLDLAVFYLLTFCFYLKVAKPGGKRSDWAQLGMVGSFVLAATSKEPAVTLPFLATIYEHFYREDRATTSWTQKAARYGLLWIAGAGYVVFRIQFFGTFAPVILTPRVTWYEAFLSGFALTGQYLWKMIWPVHLSAFYAFHKSASVLDPRVMAGMVGLILCAGIFLALWKHDRPVSFGLVWFFATLAPVLNSRWLGPNVFTERYLYLPSMGLCWVGAWAIVRAWKRMEQGSSLLRRAAAIALGMCAILALVRIVVRNTDWRDDVTYYQRTLAAEPEATPLRVNLGAAFWNHGRPDQAEQEWREALKDAPDDAILLNNLGLAAERKKQYAEAVGYYQESMWRRPNYTDAHLNLGRIYVELGRDTEAELQLRAAVALAPLSIQARNQFGEFLLRKGRLTEAEREFERSTESVPNSGAYDYLGDIYARQGRTDRAQQEYQQAIALNEFDSHALFGLAGLCEAAGRKEEALRNYQAGIRVDPLNPEAQAALKRLQANSSSAGSSNK